METSTLTTKGQIVIPKRIRSKYGMKGGVKIFFEETKEGVLIIPMNEDYFKSFRGILKTGNLQEDMKALREEENRYERKKINVQAEKK